MFENRLDWQPQREVQSLSWLWRLDWVLALLLVAVLLLGLAVLYSASDSLRLLVAQGVRIGLGLGLFFLLAALPSAWLMRLTPVFYGVLLLLLVLVEWIGLRAGGAQRWLNVAGIRLQPSELAKIIVPMMMAWLLARQHSTPTIWQVLLAVAVMALPIGLIYRQPDLGTTLLVLASGGLAIVLSGVSWWIIGGFVSVMAMIAPVFWYFGIKDYQRARILTLLNPDSDQLGAGWHISQSVIAIGSGGLYGKGYQQGTQSRLDFLPESSTDFIFAVLAEEQGFVGVCVLLLLYGAMIWRGLYLAMRLKHGFARVVVACVFLSFFINVFVNIGMVTGLLPVVGLPLALVSYGGSSILSLLMGFGVAMNLIGFYRPVAEQKEYL